MRRLLSVILFIALFWALSVSAFAADWPPETYVMPRTFITAGQIKGSLSGLMTTIGSCVNIGLVILGILTSVSLIVTVFRRIFLGGLGSADHGDNSSYGSYRETKL